MVLGLSSMRMPDGKFNWLRCPIQVQQARSYASRDESWRWQVIRRPTFNDCVQLPSWGFGTPGSAKLVQLSRSPLEECAMYVATLYIFAAENRATEAQVTKYSSCHRNNKCDDSYIIGRPRTMNTSNTKAIKSFQGRMILIAPHGVLSEPLFKTTLPAVMPIEVPHPALALKGTLSQHPSHAFDVCGQAYSFISCSYTIWVPIWNPDLGPDCSKIRANLHPWKKG